MIPYFLFLLFIFFCYCIDCSQSGRKSDVPKILVFVGLTLFSGLRLNVGTDYESYSMIFSGDQLPIEEPGTALLMDFLKSIGGTEHLFFLIMAAVTQLFTYKVFIKYRKYFWLLVILYYCISIYYMASFNTVRSSAAIPIMLWALQYIKRNEFIKFMIISLITCLTLHFSALIFVPLYFYLKRDWTIKQIILITVTVVAMSTSMLTLLQYTPYGNYLIIGENINDETTVDLLHYLFALLSFGIILFGRKFRELKSNSLIYNYNTLAFITIILVIQMSSGLMVILLMRINNYFMFSFLLIIPLVLSSLNPQKRKVAKFFLILISFAYLVRTVIYKGEQTLIVPYNYELILFK